MPPRGSREPVALSDGVVTALVAPPGRAERVAVHIDGRRVFDLAAEVADRAGLRAGAPLTAGQQQALLDQDSPYRARERAVRLLSTRDRSRGEVEMRLRQAGFDAATAADTVEWLRGLGYLDDRRFAAAYAAEKRRTGWGPRRIRAELAAKGVQRAVVEDALESLAEAGAEVEAASQGGDVDLERVVRRRFAAGFAQDPEGASRRLVGFLARRGYDWDTIHRITRTMLSEVGFDGPPERVSDP